MSAETATATSILTRTEGSTRVVVLNRPEVRNAIDVPMRRRFVAELDAVAAAAEVRVVVITGTDPAFCAGVDFRALAESRRNGAPSGPNPAEAVRAQTKPVIAAVNGACVTGGLEIALSCDFVIASEQATFADTHARHGLVPAQGMWGMSALLPGAVGVRRAKELSLTGRAVGAEEALQLGLVNHVVSHDELVAAALAVAAALGGIDADVATAWLDVYDRACGRPFDDALAIEQQGRPPGR